MINPKILFGEVSRLMFKDIKGLGKLFLLIFTIIIAETIMVLMSTFVLDVMSGELIMLMHLGIPFIEAILITYLIGLFWKNTIQGERFTFKTIFNIGWTNIPNFLTLCIPFIIFIIIFCAAIFGIGQIPYFREAAASDSTGALVMLLPAIPILFVLIIIFIPFISIILNNLLLKEKRYFDCMSLSIKTYHKNKKMIIYVLGIGIITILVSFIPIAGIIIGPVFFYIFSIGIGFLSLQKK